MSVQYHKSTEQISTLFVKWQPADIIVVFLLDIVVQYGWHCLNGMIFLIKHLVFPELCHDIMEPRDEMGIDSQLKRRQDHFFTQFVYLIYKIR